MNSSNARSSSNILSTNLGELELQVPATLWQRPHLDAPEVRAALSGIKVPGLSTVQSTLERLYWKKYVDRIKHGHAYTYFSSVSRSALLGRMLGDVIQLLHDGRMETILSGFMRVAAEHDESSLDELKTLIRSRRERGEVAGD